jgi:hypothetical protein
MAYLQITQKISNLKIWKEKFDQFVEYRKICGELSCKILPYNSGKKEYNILFHWTNLDDLRDFICSQSFEMITELESNPPQNIKFLNEAAYQKISKYF